MEVRRPAKRMSVSFDAPYAIRRHAQQVAPQVLAQRRRVAQLERAAQPVKPKAWLDWSMMHHSALFIPFVYSVDVATSSGWFVIPPIALCRGFYLGV